MRPDRYFRISVIDAGLQLSAHLNNYPDITLADAVRQLRAGPVYRSSLDYEAAISIYADHGAAPFCSSPDRPEELRQTLFNMAVLLKPFWAKVSPLGRDRVRAVLSDDQAQCLRYAGLLDSVNEAVWRWWDDLAGHFRTVQSQKLLEIGREGELLSLEYERAKLKAENISIEPRWMSIEDNLAGYDILSYRNENGTRQKVFIEVKATTASDCIFVLTRSEWNCAIKIGSSYLFHFWILPSKSLCTASVSDVMPNIPSDNGSGSWDRVKLDLKNWSYQSVRDLVGSITVEDHQ